MQELIHIVTWATMRQLIDLLKDLRNAGVTGLLGLMILLWWALECLLTLIVTLGYVLLSLATVNKVSSKCLEDVDSSPAFASSRTCFEC